MNDVQKRARLIKLLIMDVDGVLTDGTVTIHKTGVESKGFFIPDGVGITLAHRAGLKLSIISARPSKVTTIRAKELKIETVRQTRNSKLSPFSEIRRMYKLTNEEIAYIGDDLHDIPVLRRVGLAISVKGGAPEVKRVSHYITKAEGGRGAVRETIELILKSQGKWKKVISKYLASFALSLFLLCGCGGKHPVERSESERTEPAPVQEAVERIEEGFSFTSTEAGRITLTVKGDSASRDAGNGAIRLKSPEAAWYGNGSPVFLKAQEGIFNKETENIRAWGSVYVNSERWGELRAHSVEWSPQERTITAQGEAVGRFYIADK